MAPLVIIFLLALVDFGLAVNRRLILDHAAREGARYASVGGQAFSSGTVASCDDIYQYASDQAHGLVDPVPGDVTVAYEDLNGGGIGIGDDVTVTLDYTYTLVTGFGWFLDDADFSIPMTASASARVERGPECDS
jgi:hypothetical protein